MQQRPVYLGAKRCSYVCGAAFNYLTAIDTRSKNSHPLSLADPYSVPVVWSHSRYICNRDCQTGRWDHPGDPLPNFAIGRNETPECFHDSLCTSSIASDGRN